MGASALLRCHWFDGQLIAEQMGHGFDRQFHGKDWFADEIVATAQSAFGATLEVTVAGDVNDRSLFVSRQLPKAKRCLR